MTEESHWETRLGPVPNTGCELWTASHMRSLCVNIKIHLGYVHEVCSKIIVWWWCAHGFSKGTFKNWLGTKQVSTMNCRSTKPNIFESYKQTILNELLAIRRCWSAFCILLVVIGLFSALSTTSISFSFSSYFPFQHQFMILKNQWKQSEQWEFHSVLSNNSNCQE